MSHLLGRRSQLIHENVARGYAWWWTLCRMILRHIQRQELIPMDVRLNAKFAKNPSYSKQMELFRERVHMQMRRRWGTNSNLSLLTKREQCPLGDKQGSVERYRIMFYLLAMVLAMVAISLSARWAFTLIVWIRRPWYALTPRRPSTPWIQTSPFTGESQLCIRGVMVALSNSGPPVGGDYCVEASCPFQKVFRRTWSCSFWARFWNSVMSFLLGATAETMFSSWLWAVMTAYQTRSNRLSGAPWLLSSWWQSMNRNSKRPNYW